MRLPVKLELIKLYLSCWTWFSISYGS